MIDQFSESFVSENNLSLNVKNNYWYQNDIPIAPNSDNFEKVRENVIFVLNSQKNQDVCDCLYF